MPDEDMTREVIPVTFFAPNEQPIPADKDFRPGVSKIPEHINQVLDPAKPSGPIPEKSTSVLANRTTDSSPTTPT